MIVCVELYGYIYVPMCSGGAPGGVARARQGAQLRVAQHAHGGGSPHSSDKSRKRARMAIYKPHIALYSLDRSLL